MKKAVLWLLFAVISLHSYAQNWVEVGVDTQFGPKFLPNDLIHINNRIILSGHSYNPTSQPSRIKNGFFTSLDVGHTWDTMHYFNSSFFDGANYKVAVLDTLLFFIEGEHSINQPPLLNPNRPACSGYELNLYSNSFQKIKQILSNEDLARYKWLGDVTPVSTNTVILSMLDVLALNDGSGGIPHFYLERLDINTLVMDSIALPVRMENIYRIQFVDSLRGYLVGGSVYEQLGGYLLYTQDGGRSWSVMKEATIGLFNDIVFYNRQSGILAGDEEIYFTSNGGFDWYPSSGTPTRFRAVDVCYADNNSAFVIGWHSEYVNGQSQESIQIYKSLDCGHSWCIVYKDTTPYYQHHEYKSMHISFSDENQGVAAYGYNKLIYTANGGGLSECVTGIEQLDGVTFQVYPNPNQGTFTVNSPNNKEFTTQITDLSGKVVSNKVSQGQPLQVDDLEVGVYIVRVESEGRAYYQKVVVVR